MTANTVSGGAPHASSDTMKKLKRHSALSLMMSVVGVVIVIIVGYVEDDPIIPPFILIGLGMAWFVITRIRIGRFQNRPRQVNGRGEVKPAP